MASSCEKMTEEAGNVRLTTADLVVLSVFLYQGSLHGYGLVQLLEKSNVEEWASVSKPQVYYSLRKLAKSGYLEPVDDENPANGPERVVYRAAEKAQVAMRHHLSLESWATKRSPSQFTTWSALALHATEKTVREQIRIRIAFLEQEVAKEIQSMKDLDNATGRDVDVAKAMIAIVIAQMRSELDGLPALEAALLRKG